jgi:son of sevenless-like protein
MSQDAYGLEEILPLFNRAWQYYERRFAAFKREPDEGWIRVDGERFVLVRCESLYLGLFDGMASRFGDDVAFEMIYAMARDIGKSDCGEMTSRMAATDGVARIAAGPPFFSFAGWAGVELLPDTRITRGLDCFVHYRHPNTFESEVLSRRADIEVKAPACLFSAGYSAGWGTAALGRDFHAREIQCVACGGETCEFVMAPTERLEEHIKRLTAKP